MMLDKRGISPIIAVVLLVVITVILVTIFLSFSTDLTNKSLDKTKDIKELSKSDVELFIYPKNFSDETIQFNYNPPSNLSENTITITKYKIFSDNNESSEITLDTSYSLVNGSNLLHLNDFLTLNITSAKFNIQLYTSDGTYILLKNITNSDIPSGEVELVTYPLNVNIISPIDGATVNFGESIDFNSSISGGTGIPTCLWKSDIDGELGTDCNFSKSNLTQSSHAITLTVTDDSEVKDVTVNINVVLVADPLDVNIISPIEGATYDPRESIDFNSSISGGTGTLNCSWKSDKDGTLGTDCNISKSNLAESSHAITLTVTDDSEVKHVVVNINVIPECTVGGTGTYANPFIICTVEDIANINLDLDANYILGKDIDFFNPSDWKTPPTDIATTTANWNSGAGFVPIGDSSIKFTGSFDGNNNTISNLYINRATDNVGLFGYTYTNALIKNVILEDVNVRGKTNTGGLIGNQYYGTVTNNSTTGSVVGTGNNTGGLVGNIYAGGITNSNSNSSVNGISYVGGLVGYATGAFGTTSTISSSYSNGSVTGTSSSVGGLVGYVISKFTITNSYSTSSVLGSLYVGGLTGYTGSYVGSDPVTIINCYSTGYIRSAYTTYVGGLTGLIEGYYTLTNSYWDMNTSGKSTSSGGTGKTTTQMKQQATFTSWNFTTPWNISEGASYPYLITNEQLPHPTPIAIPTPTMIYTVGDLNNIRNNLGTTSYYSLANDIDLNVSPYNTGNGWLPIGTDSVPFAGIISGNGYAIRNLYINRSATDYVGLFGYGNKYSQFNDLNLIDANVRGQNYVGTIVGQLYSGIASGNDSSGYVYGTRYVGGITGYQYTGYLLNNSSASRVTGSNSYIGGLIGYSNAGSVASNYATGIVAGGSQTGGLIGYTEGTGISNNYSTGAVSGSTYVGGLIGYLYSPTIYYNYSTGAVTGSSSVGGLIGGVWTGSASGCFWDMNTSGRATSASGTGKTTVQMKTQSTFTGASWNFTTIWNSTEGTTYPYLRTNIQSPLPQ